MMACEKKAPGTKSARSVHLLQWSNFIKDADIELRRQAKEFQSQTGIEVTIETVNANDLNARFTAAVESGQGPDILQTLGNQTHLYAGGLMDVADLAEEVGAAQGGYYSVAKKAAIVDGVWRAVPYHIVGGANVYRKDIFAELGIPRFPETYFEYLEVGKKLKANGTPVGTYPVLEPDANCFKLSSDEDRPMAVEGLALGAHQCDALLSAAGADAIESLSEAVLSRKPAILNSAVFVAAPVGTARAEFLPEKHVPDAVLRQRPLQRSLIELRLPATIGN